MKLSASVLALMPLVATSTKLIVDYLDEFKGNTVSIASGNITNSSAVVWARCNSEQDSKVYVTYSPLGKRATRGGFKDERIESGYATGKTDYTIKFELTHLAPNTNYEYRFACEDYNMTCRNVDCSNRGSFWTAPGMKDKSRVSFLWTADIGGQGFGRNPHLEIEHKDGSLVTGGFVIFESMRKLQPDFAIFQGDMIHADTRIPVMKGIPVEVGGGVWENSPAKNFVAQELDEFRANWKYNLGDKHYQKFLEEVPIYTQWDDQEVTDNWWPGEILTKDPYRGLPANFLASRAKQALFEFNPIATEGDIIYRSYNHGVFLDVFLLDERSYRGPNPHNDKQTGNAMLGRRQIEWIKSSLKHSKAKYKIISTHDPVTVVSGEHGDYDSWGQDDPYLLGRELEMKEILKFIKEEDLKNVIFLSSDVRFSAAILTDPETAMFKEFKPFYEFVVGPGHAGAAGVAPLDPTFGPKYIFAAGASNSGLELNPDTPPLPQNTPPPHLQTFGHVFVDGHGTLTVQFVDIYCNVVYENVIEHW